MHIFFATLFAWTIYYRGVGVRWANKEHMNGLITRLVEAVVSDASTEDVIVRSLTPFE